MDSFKYPIYALIITAGIVLGVIVRYPGSFFSTRSSTRVETKTLPQLEENRNDREVVFGSLALVVPAGWIKEIPSSSIRIGQFRLSGEEIGAGDAELAIFSGIGGGTESNLRRWYNQFRQPDGSSSSEKANNETFSIGDKQITLADLSGTYVGSAMSMSDKPVNRPGYRLLSAIVETFDDHYYFKLIGPQATVDKWDQSFKEFIMSIHNSGF